MTATPMTAIDETCVFKRLPADEHLSVEIVKADTERRSLSAQLAAARAEAEALADPAHDEKAAQADREAAATAIRAGKGAHTVGHPEQEQLEADRKALAFKIEALAEARNQAEADIGRGFDKIAANTKTSGFDAALAAREKYRKALAALGIARNEFHEAAALAAFIRHAADAHALEHEPRGEDGYSVNDPAWLRAAALRTQAHRHAWRPDLGAPHVSVLPVVSHLGIRAADAALPGSTFLGLLKVEINDNSTGGTL